MIASPDHFGYVVLAVMSLKRGAIFLIQEGVGDLWRDQWVHAQGIWIPTTMTSSPSYGLSLPWTYPVS